MDENMNEELNHDEVEKVPENLEGEVVTTEETAEKKKGKGPIITAILGGVVVCAFIVLVIMYLLSPKTAFFRLVGGAFSEVSNEVGKIENSVFGRLLTLDVKDKLTADIKMSGNIETDDEEIREWVQNLEKFELNIKENMDISNNYTNATADFLLNGEKYLSGTLIQNKDSISAKLDNVTDGFITVDNNKLSELWEKIGYNGPDSLSFELDMFKDLNFSKADIKELKNAVNAFGSAFTTAFSDEDFSYGEGTVSYDEGTIECKSMDFTVDPVKLNDGLIAGLEKVIGKEKYVEAVYKFFSTLDKVSGYEPLTRDEFKENLEMLLQEIYSLEFSDSDPGFIVRVYYKGNDVLKVDMLSGDYNTKIMEFTAVNSKDSGYYKFYDGMMIYEDKVTTIENVTTHALTIDYINYETGEIDKGYGSEINIIIDNINKDEQSINLVEKVRLLSYDEDFENLDIMTIDPTIIRNYTVKGRIDGDINNLEINLTDSDNDFSSTFSINATVKENAEFENVLVDESNNFDVSTKTDEEIINKKNKIIENWNSTAGSDSTKVQQFEAAVSMYLGMFISTNEFLGTGDYYETIDPNSVTLEGLE